MDGLEKAFQELEQKTRNETRNKTIAEIVKNLIKNGATGSLISAGTGYSRNQIDSIAKKMNLSVVW